MLDIKTLADGCRSSEAQKLGGRAILHEGDAQKGVSTRRGCQVFSKIEVRRR